MRVRSSVIACASAAAMVAAATTSAIAAPRALHGLVAAQTTGAPIAAATVFTDRGDIAITDEDGFFTIEIDDARDRQLTVVAPRFATLVARIDLTGGADQRIELVSVVGAEVIEVHGAHPDDTRPLTYKLTADEIRTIPGAGNDALRAVQILPGVARIPFSFGALVLRGASPRDTEVYLDGIEVPLAFHFGGVTAFYPTGMLSDLQLVSSGFDASYGRAQGGIVSLTTREPRRDRWRVGGEFGVFQSDVNVEGPLGPGGIIAGARWSYIDPVAVPFVKPDVPLPSYWDLQVKTSFGDPHGAGRITPMVFGSLDRVSSNTLQVTNTFARIAAPYIKQWTDLALRIVPWLGVDRLAFTEVGDAQTYTRPTFPGGVRADLQRETSFGNVRGGVEVSGGYLARTDVEGSTATQVGDVMGTSTQTWVDIGLWTDGRVELDDGRFTVKPGLRVESYGLTGEAVVDPRVNVTQQLADGWKLRSALGRYHQPPTPADVDAAGGNTRLKSSWADQASLGVETEYRETFASLTGFYSAGWNDGVKVPRPTEIAPPQLAPAPDLGGLGPTFELLLEKQLGFPIYRENTGRARSYGVELLLRHSGPTWSWLAGYTLSKSERTEDPHQRIGWRPFELDERHNLNVAASRAFGKWRVGARLQVVSGVPYSPTINGTQRPFASELPTFASLDVRVDRRWHRCWGDIGVYADVQNVTNRTNIEGRTPSMAGFTDNDVAGLPIIPFVGVEFLPLR